MAKIVRTAPGWYDDQEDLQQMRWWDGDDWTSDRQPRSLWISEQHLRLAERTARNVETIKSIVVFYLVLSIIGVIGLIIAMNANTNS